MTDRIIFVCVLLLAGVYFWATAQIHTLEIGDPLGPKAFPRMLGVGLLITAAMLLGEIVRSNKTDKRPVLSDEGEKVHVRVIAGVVIATAIFLVSFEFLGYVLSVTIYLLAMTYYFNKQGRWLVNGLTSVIYSVVSYLLFTKALGVNLPAGLLPF